MQYFHYNSRKISWSTYAHKSTPQAKEIPPALVRPNNSHMILTLTTHFLEEYCSFKAEIQKCEHTHGLWGKTSSIPYIKFLCLVSKLFFFSAHVSFSLDRQQGSSTPLLYSFMLSLQSKSQHWAEAAFPSTSSWRYLSGLVSGDLCTWKKTKPFYLKFEKAGTKELRNQRYVKWKL